MDDQGQTATWWMGWMKGLLGEIISWGKQTLTKSEKWGMISVCLIEGLWWGRRCEKEGSS